MSNFAKLFLDNGEFCAELYFEPFEPLRPDPLGKLWKGAESEFRVDYPNGQYQLFNGTASLQGFDASIQITSPILEGSIYDREGAD